MVVGNRPKTVDGFALGDLVEIRSAEEILAGLDSRGEQDSLQFMPEMLQYCGRTFRIDKIAGKTCDTVNWSGMREAGGEQLAQLGVREEVDQHSYSPDGVTVLDDRIRA